MGNGPPPTRVRQPDGLVNWIIKENRQAVGYQYEQRHVFLIRHQRVALFPGLSRLHGFQVVPPHREYDIAMNLLGINQPPGKRSESLLKQKSVFRDL